jgi:DhnA family fructose-bisphosphate aldolase class Ia
MTGTELRLKRFFSHNQKAVVIAADHGMFDGPISGLEDMKGIPDKIHSSVDAVLLSPGMLKLSSRLFDFKGAPMAIVRINWSSVYCFHWNYNGAYTVPACSVKDAVALGADAVLISLTLQTGSEAEDAKNVETYCRLRSKAGEYGIPVIGEYFPVQSGKLTKEQMQEQIYTGCRILSELGTDLIKTFYTQDFKKITDNIATPILALGAERKDTQLEALQLASDAILNGAKGIVFGRNAIQVNDPIQFQAALCAVIKNQMEPSEAIAQYDLKG